MTTYEATCPRCCSSLDAPGATATQSLLCGACNHVFDSTPPQPRPVTSQGPILRRKFRVPAKVRWTILAVLWFGVCIAEGVRMGRPEAVGFGALASVLIPASIVLYFAPAIVAYRSKRRQTVAIAVLNIFLGWTFLGWVAALVWACVEERPWDRAA